MKNLKDESLSQDPSMEDYRTKSSGYMRYYGLFWKKEYILSEDQIIAGVPSGWIGQGSQGRDYDPSKIWVNFWDQKGVYVLYDEGLIPVYAGQAGTTRKSKSSDQETSGGTIGIRLSAHKNGKYRNGWEYFSWFGFLESDIKDSLKKKLKGASFAEKFDPKWIDENEKGGNHNNLNSILDSFEAVLIEAFTPRFNARGGNLRGAVYVNQLEKAPSSD